MRGKTEHTRRQATGALVGLLTGLILVGVMWLLVQTYQTSDTIREQQQVNKDTITTIEECTTPGEQCFEEAQERMRSAINDVNRVSIIAAACADRTNTQTVAEIQECVLDELRKEHKR